MAGSRNDRRMETNGSTQGKKKQKKRLGKKPKLNVKAWLGKIDT